MPTTTRRSPGISSTRTSSCTPSTRMRAGASNDVELDPLRERQVARVIDRVGLAAHVGLPRVGAGLAAAARVFLAAEGAADLRARGTDVHVGDAAVAAR